MASQNTDFCAQTLGQHFDATKIKKAETAWRKKCIKFSGVLPDKQHTPRFNHNEMQRPCSYFCLFLLEHLKQLDSD